MNNDLLNIVEDKQTSEFYPTPKNIVEKMLDGVDFDLIQTILEPSAGKGDILRVLADKIHHIYADREFDIDCIEIDANLRQILKYNFSDERKRELKSNIREITKKYNYCEHHFSDGWRYYNNELRKYVPIPNPDKQIIAENEKELSFLFKNGIHIIHDDFLTYSPFKTYDLIIMNPPFSNGDKHLLKALKMQEKGGNIVCLLNAETIKNPYTETRRELLEQLNKHNAQIEFINNAFSTAERKTNVEIALIKVVIERVQEQSDIYERMKVAEKMSDIDPECTQLEVTDLIKAMVARFNVEVKSGVELIRQYKALIPYMTCGFGDDSFEKKPILRLTDNNERGYDSVSINDFLKRVRLKYWQALLANEKFIGKLTSKLQTEYQEKVYKLSDYDFSEFNIYTLSAEMNAQIKTGIEDEIIAMFDRLTEEHSWYPETQKNRHYYDGWATNKAHKIGKKVIIPCYGIFDSYDGRPRVYNVRGIIHDIEKILNFLDGNMTAEIDMERTLNIYFDKCITKKVPFKFFNATFYKKGTMHLEFTCPELIERFNIYAAQNKKWLPPCYGKKKYNNMTNEEKAVIDGFQGEAAYNEILNNSNYYLSSPTATRNNNLLLSGA